MHYFIYKNRTILHVKMDATSRGRFALPYAQESDVEDECGVGFDDAHRA